MNFEGAKNRALEILSDFGYKEPPVNPVLIARETGIDVFFAEFKAPHDRVSGFFTTKGDKIYVNKAEYPKRMTFTIAHELGHYFLHRDWLASSDYHTILRQQPILEVKDPKEQEANTFAANLLVPRFMLDKYKDIATIDELSKLFIVSRQVISNRIRVYYGGTIK